MTLVAENIKETDAETSSESDSPEVTELSQTSGDSSTPDDNAIGSCEIAAEVKDVSVMFRSYDKRAMTFKESLIRFAKTGSFQEYSQFPALRNVSFKVPTGGVFGIIGSNGAGKSTLLKVLCGVLPPTSGEVRLNGNFDSLIQLGAGFDAELNAVENIYLSGSLHGKSKEEISSKIPDILEFAELTEFANTPIKYYSSGMYARLGFSVAIDRKPDILIVDEVLAVGDERFQEKCKKVFQAYLDQNKTVIMVSHSLNMLENTASNIMLLSKGEIAFIGEPKEAIERYRSEEYQTRLKSD